MAKDLRTKLRPEMFDEGLIDFNFDNYDIYSPDGEYWATVSLFSGMKHEAMFRWILEKYPISEASTFDRVKLVPIFNDPETKGFWIDNPFSAEERKDAEQKYYDRIAHLHAKKQDHYIATLEYKRRIRKEQKEVCQTNN